MVKKTGLSGTLIIAMNTVSFKRELSSSLVLWVTCIRVTCISFPVKMHKQKVSRFTNSGAPEREARQRSTMGKKIW